MAETTATTTSGETATGEQKAMKYCSNEGQQQQPELVQEQMIAQDEEKVSPTEETNTTLPTEETNTSSVAEKTPTPEKEQDEQNTDDRSKAEEQANIKSEEEEKDHMAELPPGSPENPETPSLTQEEPEAVQETNSLEDTTTTTTTKDEPKPSEKTKDPKEERVEAESSANSSVKVPEDDAKAKEDPVEAPNKTDDITLSDNDAIAEKDPIEANTTDDVTKSDEDPNAKEDPVEVNQADGDKPEGAKEEANAKGEEVEAAKTDDIPKSDEDTNAKEVEVEAAKTDDIPKSDEDTNAKEEEVEAAKTDDITKSDAKEGPNENEVPVDVNQSEDTAKPDEQPKAKEDPIQAKNEDRKKPKYAFAIEKPVDISKKVLEEALAKASKTVQPEGRANTSKQDAAEEPCKAKGDKADEAAQESEYAPSSEEDKTDEEIKSDGDSSSDDEYKASDEDDKASNANKPPLHRLMVDFKERKEQTYRENLENARKSDRPRKETDRFVAGPASIFLDAEKQKTKKQRKQKRKRTSQALESSKQPRIAKDEPEESMATPKEEQVAVTSKQETTETPKQAPQRREAPPSNGIAVPTIPSLGTRGFTSKAPARVASKPREKSSVPPASSKKKPTKPKQISKLPSLLYYPHYMDVQMACQGKTFPQQLMLMMTKKVAQQALYWSPDGRGTTFIIDCAWFRDSVMKAFFPNNPFRRIQHTLKRWGFQRNYLDLPDGIMAFYHPLFQRDMPNLASKIACKDIKPVKKSKTTHSSRKQKQVPVEDSFQQKSFLHAVRHHKTKCGAPPTHSVPEQVKQQHLGRLREAQLARLRALEPSMPTDMPPPSALVAPLNKKKSNSGGAHERRSVPKSIKMSSLQRPCTGDNSTLRRHNSVSNSAKPVHRAKKEPEVVDLTSDDDEEVAPVTPEINRAQQQRARGRSRAVPPFPSPRQHGPSSSHKRKLEALDDIRGIKTGKASPGGTRRGDSPPETPRCDILGRFDSRYVVTPPEKQSNQGHVQENERRYLAKAEEGIHLQHRIAHKKLIGEMASSSGVLKHHLHDPFSSRMQEMAVTNALAEERALKLRKQALEKEFSHSNGRMAGYEMLHRRANQVVAGQDDETERRRRLSSALYGSGRREKTQNSWPKSAAGKEPSGATRSRPKSREPVAAAPAVVAAPSLQAADLINALRQPDPSHSGLLGAIQNQNLLASAAASNPLAALLQQPTQQDVALNGFLNAFAPPSAPSTEASLEQFLLLHRLQQR